MLSSRFHGTERTAIRSASSMPLGGSDQQRAKSGVYSTQMAPLDLAEFLPIDDDEPVTKVRHDKPEPGSSIPAPSPLPEQRAPRPLWHVGMVLDAHELSRLWARNAATLRGRVFVWSDQANSWMSLREATPSSVTVNLRPTIRAEADPIGHAQRRQNGVLAIDADESGWQVDGATPIDLTGFARAEAPTRQIRHASLIAAVGICLAALVGLWIQRSAPVRTPQAAARGDASRDSYGATDARRERTSPVTQCRDAETARSSVSSSMVESAVLVEDLPLLLVSRRLETF